MLGLSAREHCGVGVPKRFEIEAVGFNIGWIRFAATLARHRKPPAPGFEGAGNATGSNDPITPERDGRDVIMAQRGQAAINAIHAANPGYHR